MTLLFLITLNPQNIIIKLYSCSYFSVAFSLFWNIVGPGAEPQWCINCSSPHWAAKENWYWTNSSQLYMNADVFIFFKLPPCGHKSINKWCNFILHTSDIRISVCRANIDVIMRHLPDISVYLSFTQTRLRLFSPPFVTCGPFIIPTVMVIESPTTDFWYIVLHYRGNWQWFCRVISAPWIPLPQVFIFSANRLSVGKWCWIS